MKLFIIFFSINIAITDAVKFNGNSTVTSNVVSKELAALNRVSIFSSNDTLINASCKDTTFVATTLRKLVSTGNINSAQDVGNIAHIIVKIDKCTDDVTKANEMIFTDVLHTVSHLLQTNVSLVAQAQMEYHSSTKILQSIDNLSWKISKLLNSSNSLYNINTNNIAFTIAMIGKQDTYIIRMQSLTRDLQIMITDNKYEPFANTSATMVIPKEAFGNKSESFLVYSLCYRINNLFLTEEHLKNLTGKSYKNKLVVKSNVFSAKIVNEDVKDLVTPVRMAFRKSPIMMNNETCQYWDFQQKTSYKHMFGGWSKTGCRMLQESTIKDFVICECNHLTNFALILDINQDINNPLVLEVISFIGCMISLSALLLTFIVYAIFSNLRRKLAPKILVCLSISLMALLITFIAGAERTSPRDRCQVIAALLQYFVLSSFCWMAVEGFNLYRNYIIVFRNSLNGNRFMLRASILAWGIPLIIVGLTAGMSPEELGNNKICIVRGSSFYYGMLLPVCLVLLGNFISIVVAMVGIQKSTRRFTQIQKSNFWTQCRRVVIFSTILGLTWIFGVFAVGNLRDMFQWLFCIFNSLQGLSIFVLFVVRNDEVAKEMTRFLGRKQSSVTSSVNNMGRSKRGMENHELQTIGHPKVKAVEVEKTKVQSKP